MILQQVSLSQERKTDLHSKEFVENNHYLFFLPQSSVIITFTAYKAVNARYYNPLPLVYHIQLPRMGVGNLILLYPCKTLHKPGIPKRPNNSGIRIWSSVCHHRLIASGAIHSTPPPANRHPACISCRNDNMHNPRIHNSSNPRKRISHQMVGLLKAAH